MRIAVVVALASCCVLGAQPQAELPGREFGPPIAVGVPAPVRKQMQDQDISLARMRLDFEKGAKGGVVLEHEGVRSEIPVILAAFTGERCDRVLAHADWKARNGHYVDLAFSVRTLPAILPGLKVRVEHRHLQGEQEALVRAFEVATPAHGDPWDALRLPGSLPGVNRYCLVVSYTAANNETASYTGFSHWVIVQAPPMFEFRHAASVTATQRKAGSDVVLAAQAVLRTEFLLHAGLRPEDCSLRIARRGRRELGLSRANAAIRRVIEQNRAPEGWHEVGKTALSQGAVPGLDAPKLEGSFVTLTYRHELSMTASALPMVEDWDYRFELLHKDMPEPMAIWQATIDLRLSAPADLERARLRVQGTGLSEPVEAAFTEAGAGGAAVPGKG